MLARVANWPWDPLLIARSLDESGGRAIAIVFGESRAVAYVAADPDAESSSLDPLDEDSFSPEAGPLSSAPRWIGAIPYDACRAAERSAWSPREDRPAPIVEAAHWFRYGAVVRVDRARGEVLVIGRD